MKKILLVVAAAALVFAGFTYLRPDNGKTTGEAIVARTIPVETRINGGQTVKSDIKIGSTALDYLKNQAKVETKGEGVNAYVVSIDDRTADSNKKEFWSFYVNGKMAEVGAGSYELKPNDKIEWKIETY